MTDTIANMDNTAIKHAVSPDELKQINESIGQMFDYGYNVEYLKKLLDLCVGYSENGLSPLKLLEDCKGVLADNWSAKDIHASDGPLKVVLSQITVNNEKAKKEAFAKRILS